MGLPEKQKRVAFCPHCGANLLECGIMEVVTGGHAETRITFNGTSVAYGGTNIDHVTDQWVTCMNCDEDIQNDVTAHDIVCFADESTDTIDGISTIIEVI